MGATVLIVDDHATFRRFARQLLEEGGFDVVGEADTVAGALEAAARLRPEAVLLDVLLPDGSGLAAASALSATTTAVIVLTSSRTADDLGAALRAAAARGFIPKNELSAQRFAELVGVP